MLDQSFSAENFRTILDIENRKGVHVEEKLSMIKIREINDKIRDCNSQIREKKKIGDEESVRALFEQKKLLRKNKETELTSELENISRRVASKDFMIKLNKIKIPSGKTIYTTPNTPEYFFTLKHIQYCINKLFGVKQANRFAIVDQLKILLSDQFPKYVLRTDIKDFYESIPHKHLLGRIEKDNLLTPFSKKIIRGILDTFKSLSGSDKGIPRGIGVSAYLAELFMRDIDTEIRELPGVTYYARYVDDIVVIFTPIVSDTNRNYKQELKKIIEKKELKLNRSKTNQYDLTNKPDKTFNLEYLGYKFQFGIETVKTFLTTKKIFKYKNRLETAFNDYLNYSKVNEKKARNLLVKRIKFLCGNTKLSNNKKNILTGIYYSNSQLTEYRDLKRLDRILICHINSKINSQHLKSRLKKYGFKDGYIDKRFSSFQTLELSEIMKVWKKRY